MIKVLESASEGLILDKDNKMIVASQISLNLKGEWDAIEGYNKLIPFLEANSDQDAVDVIKSIIADEKAHAEKLNIVLLKYDGDIKAED